MIHKGRGGGQVVSMLAFYNDDPNSNPVKAYTFLYNLCLKRYENKQKEARVGPFKNFFTHT